MPEKIVAQLGAKSFELINGIDAEQEFVYILKFCGKFARQIKRIDAANGFAWFKVLNALDVLKARQCGSVADDVDDLVDSVVKFSEVDILVKTVSVVIAAREINGGNFQFRSDERDVGEGALRSFKTFAGDVGFKFRIGAVVEDSVAIAFAVNFNDELEVVDFIRQLLLLMSEAESFSPDAADFLVASEEQPRFNLRGLENFAESENAATIVAANALRAHQNIFVSRKADIANGLFVNGVQVSDEHDEVEN